MFQAFSTMNLILCSLAFAISSPFSMVVGETLLRRRTNQQIPTVLKRNKLLPYSASDVQRYEEITNEHNSFGTGIILNHSPPPHPETNSALGSEFSASSFSVSFSYGANAVSDSDMSQGGLDHPAFLFYGKNHHATVIDDAPSNTGPNHDQMNVGFGQVLLKNTASLCIEDCVSESNSQETKKQEDGSKGSSPHFLHVGQVKSTNRHSSSSVAGAVLIAAVVTLTAVVLFAALKEMRQLFLLTDGGFSVSGSDSIIY